MPKTTKKRTPRSKTKAMPAEPARQHSNRSNPDKPPAAETTARSGTKQERAIAMLRSERGATIAALMEATGWQQHSVRGFLAGVVRKRLGLPLDSMKVDGLRVYRIARTSGPKPKAAAARHASSSP